MRALIAILLRNLPTPSIRPFSDRDLLVGDIEGLQDEFMEHLRADDLERAQECNRQLAATLDAIHWIDEQAAQAKVKGRAA